MAIIVGGTTMMVSAGLPARPAALLLAAGLGVLPEEVHDGHQLVQLAQQHTAAIIPGFAGFSQKRRLQIGNGDC